MPTVGTQDSTKFDNPFELFDRIGLSKLSRYLQAGRCQQCLIVSSYTSDLLAEDTYLGIVQQTSAQLLH
jgi:hypothetical protein